ncbi:hypothetical protein [Streptomyces sp. BE303]|uniref:hypothetical protein n=1 Tax=Streptomyces sp. BE303 TaxID=3002528 RepID=UPI002E759E81|nr:hypothetical protein [Streptomyces sp. BE303]MED7953888.1 hypothetical protein [Streptomyces sp. BE303]
MTKRTWDLVLLGGASGVGKSAAREPGGGVQARRAEVSARYSRWLGSQARLHALPVVDGRPWSTLADRLDHVLAPAQTSV